jgi:hypothetical protein
MQYGWDFAGLWFELWTKAAGTSSGWPAPPTSAHPAADIGPFQRSAAPAAESSPIAPRVSDVAKPQRLRVSVVSGRPTAAKLELCAGPPTELVIHALRPEGFDAPPIRSVEIESNEADETITVKVVVSADAPPGVYNAMVIDAASNTPRGTFSLTVESTDDKS